MQRDLTRAAALLVLLAAPAALAQPARAQPPAAPAWRQIYENGQITYYVDTRDVQPSGESRVTSLLEYKVPQVIGAAQVWSMVSHMKLHCDQNRMISTDNTLYALKMGGGPAVATQPINDSWHAPQPDSIGGLIWSAACGKP